MISVLIVGATGMVGRPIARALAADPLFDLRALVRSPDRARALLPPSVRLVRGDVRDPASLDSALRGVHAVYANFNTPFNPRDPFDPDRDGTAALLDAARRAGVSRFARTSALGCPDARRQWWAIDRKARTDESLLNSDIPSIIVRPTWLCECLPLLVLGPLALQPRFGDFPIWWIAGEDLGRLVAAALAAPPSAAPGHRILSAQGPEGVPLHRAVARFARALPRRRLVTPVLGLCMRGAGLFAPGPRYFTDLIDMSRRWTTQRLPSAPDLPEPRMTIEDYAASIPRSGDWPRK